MSFKARAMPWAAIGIPTFPIKPGTKEPAHAGGYKIATTDAAQISDWDRENADYGVGLYLAGHVDPVTGAPDPWFALDVDNKSGKDGSGTLAQLLLDGNGLPETLSQATPSGGFHHIFRGSLPSSVERIGNGLDVRGEGGYIVAYGPPARTDVADAPGWLITKGQKPAHPKLKAPDGVEIDAPHIVDHARRYLRAQPAGIIGQGSDDKAYRLACELLDFGLSGEMAATVLQEEWGERSGFDIDWIETKVYSAGQYKENEGGSKAPRSAQETFANAPALATTKSEKAEALLNFEWQFGLHDPVADAALPPITYRDPNKLWPNSPAKTVTQVIAGPKQHKTNWVMGETFRLMLNANARVLLLALEGGYGVRTMRLKALAEHHGVPLADLRSRYQVAKIEKGGMFDLSDPDCVKAFVDWLGKGGWTDLVIDTQHRAAGPLEENSATDARRLWNAVEFIRHAGHCNVTLLHHEGKDANKGGRGSSADLASVDQQIVLKFDRGAMTVVANVKARKDGADGFTVPFKVHQPNESTVPIILPMSPEEERELIGDGDQYSNFHIGKALRSLSAFGEDRAVGRRELAVSLLHRWGDVPKTAEGQEKKSHSVMVQLGKRIKAGHLKGYLLRAGSEIATPYQFYLPEDAGDE